MEKNFVFPVVVFGQMDYRESIFEEDRKIGVQVRVRIERKVGELPLQI